MNLDNDSLHKWSEELIEKIIAELYDRSGFDAWWEDVDEDTQLDIVESLENIVLESINE